MDSKFLAGLSILLFAGALIAGVVGYRLSQPKPPAAALATDLIHVGEPDADGRREPAPAVPVVHARRALAPGRALTADDVEIRFVRAADADSFAELDAVKGRVPRRAIAVDSPLSANDFIIGSALARQLEPGERAVAVAVDEVVAGGGFLSPGDYVDVLVHVRSNQSGGQRDVAQVVLERVRVLGYGSQLGPSSSERAVDDPRRARSAVLAVAADDAPRLLLAESAGTLRLAVRGLAEEDGASRRGRRQALDDLVPAPRSAGSAPARSSITVHRGGVSQEQRF